MFPVNYINFDYKKGDVAEPILQLYNILVKGKKTTDTLQSCIILFTYQKYLYTMTYQREFNARIEY